MLRKVGRLYHYHIGRGQAWVQNRFFRNYFRHKKIKKLVDHIVRVIPFYAEFKNAQFHSLPIIDKTTYREYFVELNALTFSPSSALKHLNLDAFQVNQSKGTTGEKGVYIAKKEEILLESRSLKTFLQKDKTLKKMALFHFSAKPYLATQFLKDFNWCTFNLQHDFEKLTARLDTFQPDAIIAPSQALVQLAKYQRLKKIALDVKKIISIAEVLNPYQEKIISTAFGLPTDQVYLCAEGWLGQTCEYGTLHLNEESYYIEKEWIDKENRRFIPIVTSLTRFVHPLVRYRMEDMLVLKAKPCACDHAGMAIEKIVGRCEDMLYFPCALFSAKLKPIYADSLDNLINRASGGIEQYQFLQPSPYQLIIKLQATNQVLAQSSLEKQLILLFEKEKLKVPEMTFKSFEGIQLDRMFRATRRMLNSSKEPV